MRNLDWFVADRKLADEVAEYMRCQVWRTEIRLRYQKQVGDCQTAIEKLAVLEGSIHENVIPVQKKMYEDKIVALKAAMAEQIEKEAHFELSEAAKKLRKDLKKDPACADLAIYSFFKSYGLDVRDTGLIEEILCAGGEKLDNRTLVNSRGAVATALNVTNVIKMVFVKSYEHMVFSGTIKPVQIPECMMDRYDNVRRQQRNQSKNAAKKAARKAAAAKKAVA